MIMMMVAVVSVAFVNMVERLYYLQDLTGMNSAVQTRISSGERGA
jgi:hypothetical protein